MGGYQVKYNKQGDGRYADLSQQKSFWGSLGGSVG